MSDKISRREFVQGSLVTTAGGAIAVGVGAGQALAQENKSATAKVLPGSKNTLPKGKIGNLEMSRLLLGGNLLIGGTHTHGMNFINSLVKGYNTLEKKLETMAIAEAHGIDTVGIHTHPGIIDMLKKYRNEWGGKIKIMASPVAKIEPDLKAYFDEAKQIVDDGVNAIFIWGARAEQMLSKGRMADLMKMVDFVKELGVPSGVGAHDLNVIKECEKNKCNADYYIKTLHHHKYPTAPRPEQIKGPYSEVSPSYWCSCPDETVEYMKTVEKPWIAFKTMACGGITAKDAFPYVLNGGADFVWAGMFDFDIPDDARLIKEAVASVNRVRPWRG
ncbi:MAG: hypothetical protein A2283_06395 [Lentisphaerae bacterium RIFOXYA12_FULL_48_11]|nr:MAG: hypothetical protein A2283_06395 [Lentisphaerae bacterium RIFOXYA12_FULL_48_11]